MTKQTQITITSSTPNKLELKCLNLSTWYGPVATVTHELTIEAMVLNFLPYHLSWVFTAFADARFGVDLAATRCTRTNPRRF